MITEQAIKENWNADLIRFTGFLPPEIQIGDQNWWQLITNEQPEIKTFQPKKGFFQERGPYKDGELLITIQPFRVDIVYKKLDDIEKNVVKNIGDFEKAISLFNDLINIWYSLESFPSFQRIAFGAILSRPTDTRQSGYAVLSKYLSDTIKIDKENSSDFLYQINRPRTIKTKNDKQEITINRLSKWSVLQSKFLGFTLTEDQNKMYQGKLFYSCRLEIDINTVQGLNVRFSSEQCREIFQNLIGLGKEISIKGDIK